MKMIKKSYKNDTIDELRRKLSWSNEPPASAQKQRPKDLMKSTDSL